MAAIYCGSKFCRYDGTGVAETIRICGDVAKAVNRAEEEASSKIAVLDEAGKRHYIPLAELQSEYTAILPDGVMMFNIVSMNKELKDVVVTLSRLDALRELPYAVCRQYIYDYFSNVGETAECFSMGMSVSRDTVDAGVAEIPLAQTLMCAGIKSSFAVAVYLDDTLDGILHLFSNRKYNNVLASLKESQEALYAGQGRCVQGYCPTLAELLQSKGFMADFRRCFRVAELPHPVGADATTLSAENIAYLQQGLQAAVSDVRVQRYSRDIDLGSIERSCLLAASAAEDLAVVYVIDYDKKPL